MRSVASVGFSAKSAFASNVTFTLPFPEMPGVFASLNTENDPEPAGWDLQIEMLAADGPASGSVLLLAHWTDVSFGNRNVNGDSATMIGDLSTPGGAVPVTVMLSRAGEHWYIDSVTVQGQMLQ